MTEFDTTPERTHTSIGFRALAMRRLHRHPPEPLARANILDGPSDFELNPDAVGPAFATMAATPAAVLVPIVERSHALTVLFTQRTDHLPAHAGQISFPGGKIDRGETPLEAALREAREEVGLNPSHIEPVGYLDRYRTGTGFSIIPVVALVQPDFSLSLNRQEVADAFEVPLSFLLQDSNFQKDVRTIAGRERSFYAIPYGERYIWGATAGILMNMLRRMTLP
jgi:8-oxo-dGTP pyrophosphatase MutT (NUDIX family)